MMESLKIHSPICFPEVAPARWVPLLLLPDAADRLSIRASKSSTVVVSLALLFGGGAVLTSACIRGEKSNRHLV